MTTTTLNYPGVSFSGTSLAATFRAAADWLDHAEQRLGEPIFVAGSHWELVTEDGADDPWALTLFVDFDEYETVTG